MTELRRSSRVRQSAKHSPTYYEPDEKFSLFATPGVRPRKWQTAEAKAGYFTIKRWVPKDQQHLTADLHGGLTDPAEIAAAKLALRANSKASTRFKTRSRMTSVARLSSSRRVSLSDNSYGAGAGSAWGGGGGSGSGTNGAGPSPASSPPPPPPPTTTSSPPPLPASRASDRRGDVEDEDEERAAPFSGETVRGGVGGGGGGEGGSGGGGGSRSGGVAGEDSHEKTVDGAGGDGNVGDGDGASGASDDGGRAGGGGDGGYDGSGGGSSGGGGRGKRPASSMGLAAEDVEEPPLQSRRISPEEEPPRDYSEPSTDTTAKGRAQSQPTPPPSRSGNPTDQDEMNNNTRGNHISPGAWQPQASQQRQQQQSQKRHEEVAGSSLGAKKERGMAAGMSGATGAAVRSVGTEKGGMWGAGVGKEAAAAMQQPWGVCER